MPVIGSGPHPRFLSTIGWFHNIDPFCYLDVHHWTHPQITLSPSDILRKCIKLNIHISPIYRFPCQACCDQDIVLVHYQCYSWGGAMSHRPIQQKNGTLTTEIAILYLERMAHWNFKFIGNKWKMDHSMVCPAITLATHSWIM